MACDLLFQNDRFVITEMSYAYVDKVIYGARGYYELIDGDLVFVQGHVWPQQKWVEWAVHRAQHRQAPDACTADIDVA
jgi:hypothetical protein